MSLFKKYPNPDAVLIELLKLLDATLTPRQIIAELDIHPDYPNLLALNDVLINFGINSSAYRISKNDLNSVPLPFIAHTLQGGSEFLLVTGYNDQYVTITDQHSKGRVIKTAEFLNIFDDIVLVPEKRDTAATPASFDITVLRYPLAFTLLVLVLAAALVLHPFICTGWQTALAALFKTAGLTVSVLLLIQSVDKNNPLVQTLCGGEGKANCNAILSSKAAKVFTWLSWSEVGYFYFAGTWLALLFANQSLLPLLAVLNIVSLPYTAYSIYYQARVVKQWCVLCCMVQALLWLEFVPLVTVLQSPFNFDSRFCTAFNCLAFTKACFIKSTAGKTFKTSIAPV
jgi:uncharacterized membrane protein